MNIQNWLFLLILAVLCASGGVWVAERIKKQQRRREDRLQP